MKIASFNVKNLGMKKVRNKAVLNNLTEIMSQYSIVVILEVVDRAEKAMEILLTELNTTTEHVYHKIASTPLGRSTYKEQFVCFYRKDEVQLRDVYQYEDNQPGDEDAFAREPFILRFSCPTTVVKDLVLIPVHTHPEDTLKELDELYDVVEDVWVKWGTDNIMILGDFNAAGRYLSKKNKKMICICSEPFYWLIKDKVDTTASNSNDYTYDRIVVYGEHMQKSIVPRSAKAFNFQKKFKLTDKEALSISDHYPVEVKLKIDENYQPPRQRKKAVPRTKKANGQTPKRGTQKKKPAAPKRMRGQSAATSSAVKRRR
ncbi:deoxyribonuclease-1-like [Cololabis saira]|uniref:deoxyribonuclease-1-like n=1 Tax=Cololabis saira TaxID=129043 RepID=UPI002AD3B0DA|nr:deoxyribonuclease-1-like [Cololabis saira]XP_061584461.1 deoxyribonuclease-1-like [Cololabis saira]